ncbi:MAG: TraB/GumN family protein [Eubacteriales bacterium]|nr:TraB/GumN family protein [Eubacteriales bacterium]
MKKKIVSLLLVLALCIALVGCDFVKERAEEVVDRAQDVLNDIKESYESDSEQDTFEAEGPILYKVSDDNGNVIWLFGSIHIARDDFYPLPDYVTDAFESSDALAVEFDVNKFEKDTASQTESIMQMLYMDGTTIKDHISEDIYDDAVEILTENETYNVMLDYYMPCMWSSTIDQYTYVKLGYSLDNGIDRHFLNLAESEGKTILDVESAQYQYEILSGFSDETQEFMLQSSVESYNNSDEADEEMTRMMDLWVSGDEYEFASFLESEADEFETQREKDLYEEYTYKIRTVRNEEMTDWAEQTLNSGQEVFMCVGAAHIIGDGAVASNLKDRGYKVERVY